MKELGVEPGLPSYFGVFAPGGTPAPVVEKLAAEFSKPPVHRRTSTSDRNSAPGSAASHGTVNS